jgi:anaerobic selenocysteine-containing dehydrogenase
MASEAKSQSKSTTDHEEIRRWVEEHGGRPVIVRGTRDESGSGVLRIDFPGGAGEDELEPVSWDEWFEIFDRNQLAFLYQEEKASGEDSTFFKLVRR